MSTQNIEPVSGVVAQSERVQQMMRVIRRLKIGNGIALSIIGAITVFVALLFITIIIYLVIQGITYLFVPAFYSSTDVAGIGPELFNSFYILVLAELFLFPVSLAAAIYLVEYVPRGRFVTIIHFAAETLAGVPSIVLGLFGFVVFGAYAHFGISRLSGALTLLCLNLPLALRLFEDALTAVPRDLREGGLALGATKWHTIRTVVLPSALPGLVTGLILTAGKIIGEAAALVFTMGTINPSNVFTLNPLIPGDTLTIHLWYIKTQGLGSSGLTFAQTNAVSAGSAALLIVILLVINLGARGLGRLIQRRVTAA
jgi:phosphate transport system permease protein